MPTVASQCRCYFKRTRIFANQYLIIISKLQPETYTYFHIYTDTIIYPRIRYTDICSTSVYRLYNHICFIEIEKCSTLLKTIGFLFIKAIVLSFRIEYNRNLFYKGTDASSMIDVEFLPLSYY